MIDADLIRQLARHEARLESLRETIDHERQLTRAEVEGLRKQVRDLDEALTRFDVALRGHDGDNGLTSRVKALETRWGVEDERRRRWDARTWAVALAVLSALLALGRSFIVI